MVYERNEKKRQYTLEDLEDLLDSIPYEVWIKGEDGKYKYVNNSYSQKIGVNKEEIIGKNDYELMNITEQYQKNSTYSLEDEKDSDNECIRKLTIVLKEEIRKRVEIEHELKLILETSLNLWGIVDKNGIIKKVNNRWTEFFGWTENELIGKSFISLVHPDNIEKTCEKQKIIREKKDVMSYLNRYKCKNKEYKLIEWNWKNLNDNDDLIFTGRDITEEQKLEKDKERLESEVALENLKTEFFTNMSHEFKTPLNIILTTVQVVSKIIEEYNNKRMIRYISGIKQNSYRLLRLVNNLIDITKIDGGYYELKLGNYNIVSVVEDIVSSVAEYIVNMKRNIIFDTSEEEIILACDPEKIERIILNLLSNALKYTDEYGNIEVNINADNDNKKVIISVKNDGAPIPKEDAQKIFKRFKQSDKLSSRGCEGSGIGLSLVQALVEMHGGRIWVNEGASKGAEFQFYLPIEKVKCEEDSKIHTKELNSKIEKCNIEFSDVYSI